MHAVQSLPETYHALKTLDIAKSPGLLFGLNVAGLVVLVISGWLFTAAVFWLRPEDAAAQMRFISVHSLIELIVLIFSILGLTAANLILHEAIHGIFFWIFTRSRPKFAFRGVYAYAAAPGWFLSRNAYLITGLAPLVLISLAGLMVIWLVPASALLAVWFVLIMNASGAVGDLFTTLWVLRQNPRSYFQDLGDNITHYAPQSS
jgi:hypothetical protein